MKVRIGFVWLLGITCWGQQSYTITTVAGGGQPSSGNGDGGLATSAVVSPNGVGVDPAGNLYIADSSNRIRKVSTSGIITTVAGGSCCALGDGGPALSALLASPSAVVADAAGNLYIADTGNGRVRKVSTAGIISTYAAEEVSW